MDHIKLPVDCNPLKITVPYLVTPDVEYDGEDFSTFPTRRGLTTASTGKLTLTSLQQKSGEYGVGFVQAWLYFGLLMEILGPDYRKEDWSKDNKICSSSLPAQIQAKKSMISSLSAGEIVDKKAIAVKARENNDSSAWEINGCPGSPRSVERNRIKQLISNTLQTCDDIDEPWEVLGWRETHLAIRILAGRLGEIVSLPPPRAHLKRKVAPSIALIWQHTVEQGTWCIHQIRYLSSQVSHETLFYFANLRRYGRSESSHIACAFSDRCVACNIDDASYEIAHTKPNCDCRQAQAPVKKMYDILHRGGIPVLKCLLTSAAQVMLDYVPAAPNAKYAAISHVWADGLGNPWGQSIPRCQLDQLVSRVIQANRLTAGKSCQSDSASMDVHDFPVYLWLDVYCVPAPTKDLAGLIDLELQQQSEVQRLKSVALARMTASYSWAQYVLVLDSELAGCRVAKWTQAEIMARIAISMWNTRCWIYQEFVLGKQIVMYFKSGPEMLFDASSNKWVKSGRSFQLPLSDKQERKLWNMETHYVRRKTGSNDRTSAFISLCNTIKQKTSTKPEDAFDILANLLGLSSMEMSTLKPCERTKAVLLTLHVLPLDLLLIDAPRLLDAICNDQPPCRWDDRWIPTSIYQAQMDQSIGLMEATDEGIMIDSSTFWRTSNPAAAAFLMPRCDAISWTAMWSPGSGESRPQTMRFRIALGRHGRNCPMPCKSNYISLLVLRRSNAGDAGTGALFVPLRTKGNILHVSFYSNVTWTKLGGDIGTDDLNLTPWDPWHESGGVLLECGNDAVQLNHERRRTNLSLDTTTWPTLKVRRDKLEHWKEVCSALSWLSFAMIPGLFAILAPLIPRGSSQDHYSWKYLGFAVFPLLLAVWPRYFSKMLLDYKSLQSHLDDGARSRKLREVLPSLTTELLPFHDRLFVLAFYVILLPLEPFYWVAAALKWVLGVSRRTFHRGRKRPRSPDLSDGSREGVDLA